MLLIDAIARFLDARIAEGRSYKTARSYACCLRSFVRHMGEDCLLADVDENVLRGYLKDARQRHVKHDTNPHRKTVNEPLSRESIRTYYRHIRAFFSWCLEEELITHNPTLRVKMPPAPQHAPKDLTDEDFWKIVYEAGSGGKLPERDRALVLLIGDTGARAGGIVGLTLDRVDLQSAEVEVIEKGDRSRIIPIRPETVDALREWLAVRPARGGEAQVFTSYQGGPLTTWGLYQVIKRIAKRAGVTGRFNPHAFRHFLGRKWMEGGGDIATLSDMLGHTQIHITKQFYLRYDLETLRRAHFKLSPLAQMGK